MSDEILYNFGANHASLEDINGNITAIQDVRNDISNIFQVLGTVYEGEGAGALLAAHTKLDGMLDEALNNVARTQQMAQDQQDVMSALDKANAANF